MSPTATRAATGEPVAARSRRSRSRLQVPAALAALALAAACGGGGEDRTGFASGSASGSGSGSGSGVEETTTTAADEAPLTILVSNDDGVEAPGIDALVEALVEVDGVEVVVVAPATEQSGSGGRTSPSPPDAAETTLRSGHPAVAVEGFPADAVIHALDVVLEDEPPDLVISGINSGQNLGPALDLSGTVGAARAAARRGIPALAVSQGFGDRIDFAAGVEEVLAWLEDNREDLRAGTVANLNVPSCPSGERGEVVEVAAAVGGDLGRSLEQQSCDPLPSDPRDDEIEAFLAGFVTLSEDVGLGS